MHFEQPNPEDFIPEKEPTLILEAQDLPLAELAANAAVAQSMDGFQVDFDRKANSFSGPVIHSRFATLDHIRLLSSSVDPSELWDKMQDNGGARITEARETPEGLQFALDHVAGEHVALGIGEIAAMGGLANWLRRRRLGITMDDVAQAEKIIGRTTTAPKTTKQPRDKEARNPRSRNTSYKDNPKR